MKVELQTSKGVIILELDAGKAPKTVENFLQYVRSGFYDGTIFHRVIKDFMIQGGGMEAGMQQKETQATIENEADNGLSNLTGTIAMARTNAPHSASAQFFLNVSDNLFLNHSAPTSQGWGYCVFGQIVEGMEIVRIIEDSPTGVQAGHQDVPEEDILIEQARILDEE